MPLETVVADIVRGLERRSARVVTPRRLRPAALAPGLAQAAVDRAFFRPASIRRAIELGAATTSAPDRALAVKGMTMTTANQPTAKRP